jgi:hypothetical protein
MYDHHYKEKRIFPKLHPRIQKIFTIEKNILKRGLTVLKGEITLVLFK